MPSKADIRALKRIAESKDVASALTAYLSRFKAKRKAPSFRAAKQKQKRLGRKEAVAGIRAVCVERAAGRCECRCGQYLGILGPNVAELDHFFGRANAESVETCWMLRRACHDQKTRNFPTRSFWDERFRLHCERHNYPFRERLVKAARSAPGVKHG